MKANELKALLKRYNAKHIIYGVIDWKGEKQMRAEKDLIFCATDKAFEREVKYLQNADFVKLIYAVHA